ncbi:hypothetical protein DSM3645_19713 [Blastopirellula marina DSM 3645]|uniref:Uncharacterized protein n=1 Tax=Blastopirellula marina DSM 3645 TaxID=314230 RepID=A3ZTJ4_9BACT|nr:hypothetical protein DSM3645_19713 [Blastopirellula marina DSM 3645]
MGLDRTPCFFELADGTGQDSMFFRVGRWDWTGLHIFSGWQMGLDRTPCFFGLADGTGQDSMFFGVSRPGRWVAQAAMLIELGGWNSLALSALPIFFQLPRFFQKWEFVARSQAPRR